MTNKEAILTEFMNDTERFAEVLSGGICSIQPLCSECPFGFVDCNDKDRIKEWLESEVKEDGRN